MGMITQDPQTGAPVLPTPQDLSLAIKKFCKDSCDAMSSVINDQFIEMDYPEETKKVLRSGLMYGTGIMKGPMINQRVKRIWEQGSDGEYAEAVNKEDVPFFEAIRIWDWYPDMSVTEQDKTEGSFERHIMTKHDLRQLMKRDDFYPEMISGFLTDHPSGNYTPQSWEMDLQVIEIEAGQGSSTRTVTSGTSMGAEYQGGVTNRQLGKKYQLLEFWGYVDGADLETCGLEIPDVSLEYAANVWLLGDCPIKATLYEGALDKYKLFYYEKDETSLYGDGLARIMRHSQISIAAGARMVLDNAACVAGPQVEVNYSLMVPGSDLNSFYARKIWYREGRGVDAQYPAIRALEFNSHIPELLSIIDAFKQFGDEETTLPTWMIGQMVNNETAQATSGRMATITISIKDVVKNFDTFTEKIMRDMYAWNMEFNPRPDIKGDYNVRARGVSSLVMKEIRMQALTQLQGTLQPDDWVYLDRREFLIEILKAHDIKITIRTEEEASKIRQQQENSKATQLMYAQAEADIAYKKAQTMGQLTKAKVHNVEAEKEAQTPIEQPAGDDPRLTEGELAMQQTEHVGKAAEIRRAEEKHAQQMAQADEAHTVKKAVDTTKAAQDLAIKGKKSETEAKIAEEKAKHDLKMSEHMTKASAEAKKTAAKQKPAKTSAKPKKASK
jgi:hypothetical protein